MEEIVDRPDYIDVISSSDELNEEILLSLEDISTPTKRLPRLPLTGDFDLDTLILNNLNDKDLASVCQTNRLSRYICNNDVYWMNRTLHYYGYLGSPEYIRNVFFLENGNWEDYYKFLARAKNEDIAGADYAPDVFKVKIEDLKKQASDLIDLGIKVFSLPMGEKLSFPNGQIIGRKEVRKLVNDYIKKIKYHKRSYINSRKRMREGFDDVRRPGLKDHIQGNRVVVNGETYEYQGPFMSSRDFSNLLVDVSKKFQTIMRPLPNINQKDLYEFYNDLDNIYNQYSLKLVPIQN